MEGTAVETDAEQLLRVEPELKNTPVCNITLAQTDSVAPDHFELLSSIEGIFR